LILIQSTMASLLRSEKMEELLEKQRKLFLAVCIGSVIFFAETIPMNIISYL